MTIFIKRLCKCNEFFFQGRYFVFFIAIFFALSAVAQRRARLTNLPAVYIETENGAGIYSKENYIYSTMWYVDENDVVTQYDSMEIRGRGNSTWNMPKKPYKIKFHTKEKFLGKGYAKAKKWTLLANAADKTMMRNALTSFLGEFTGLKFNPAVRFVDLTLNGTYLGTYQISDQVEVKEHRVNIEEQDFPLTDVSDITGGYLLEADGFHDGNCFATSKANVSVRIHYPEEEEISSSQNQYVREYVAEFENALYSTDFADAEKGYRPYVDSVSLANWYISTEVSANIDGFFSTYFYKRLQDPKLYWGPLWDYDIAYGNDTRKGDTRRSLMTNVGYGEVRGWMNCMWNDPWFARLVNRRYKELVDSGLENAMLACIDSLSGLLEQSQELNYNKWGINTKVYNERVLYSSYDRYVQDLKSFVTAHVEFLTDAFAEKKPAQPTPDFVAGNYYYSFMSANTKKLFDVQDQSVEASAKVCTWEHDADRLSQYWRIIPVGEYFHITNRNGDMALNDPTQGNVGPTANVGTQLNLAVPNELDDRQLWTITPQGTAGYYNLTNKYTQHTANLNGGMAANGTGVLSYTTDDRNATSLNRLWYIVAMAELPEPEEPDAIGTVEPEEYALAYNADLRILHFGSETPERLNFMVEVYSVNGLRVKVFRADEECSVADMPAGIYIIWWKCGGKVRSAKVIL